MALWERSYQWTDRFIVQLTPWQFADASSAPGGIVFGGGQLVDLRYPPWSRVTAPVRPYYFPNAYGSVLGSFQLVDGGFFVPYWVIIVSTGCLSAFLWRNRSSQFSLCGLLIATTVVALVLGMSAWLDRAWIGK
jgi:hypothetical protein